MGTVVLITRSRWLEPPRIRHQVARHLSRYYPVIFVETPLTWKNRHDTGMEEVEPNIYRCTLSNRSTLPVKIQHYFPSVHGLVERHLMIELNKILEPWSRGPLILLNFNYDAMAVMRSGLFALKVYFCNDDFPAAVSNVLSRAIVAYREKKVAAAADLCLAVHYPLVDRLLEINPNTQLFLPGHDFEPCTGYIDRAENQPKIKVAFMGYIDSRLEYGWLLHLLQQRDMELHLIGPVEESRETKNMMGAKGLLYHRPSYGGELQTFLQKMDVLIIPYRVSMKNVLAVTASNKLFAYIAAGKPVVISDMPHYLELGEGIIYRAASPDAFAAQIRKAYREDNERFRKARFDIAVKYSWEKRGAELKDVIERSLEAKSCQGCLQIDS